VTRLILLPAVVAHPLSWVVQCPLTGKFRSTPDDRLWPTPAESLTIPFGKKNDSEESFELLDTGHPKQKKRT
jgi:hypothetical protein